MPALETRPYVWQLWIVCALFAFRIAAQPLALVVQSPLLPRFEAWHSAAIPYWALLASQLLILTALGRTAWRFSRGLLAPSRRRGQFALMLGAIYVAVMVIRLILGLTFLSHERWFASPLPTVFHLVLAWGLLAYGHAHFRAGARPPNVR